MNVRDHNRRAWNRQVSERNVWTIPESPETIAAARRGDWGVLLTPCKPVPRAWFPSLEGLRVLGLASGGGQQMPILAATGASVTSIDNSPAQLDQDRIVAEREGLRIECVQGDMADLSPFDDASFDLVFHPVSNCFVADVSPVWRETFRVLRPGGCLLAGFCNPVLYIFDDEANRRGELRVRHRLPYSDLESLSAEEQQALIDAEEPLSFGHTLQDQIGGQLAAGFALTGFYEDSWRPEDDEVLTRYMPTFIATRAEKPR